MASVPTVKLEMLLNGSWVDMAATPARLDGDTPQSRVLWSESGGAVEIVRGVGEDRAVASGTMDCVLENNDGALTVGKSTSPFFPYLDTGTQIRFSTYYGGSWHAEFGGYISAQPLNWGDEAANSCVSLVSAVDAIGMSYRLLRSVAVETTVENGPLACWAFTESDVAAVPDQSGNRQPSFTVQQLGTGGELNWASGAILPTDNSGGLVFAPATSAGQWLRTNSGIDLPASWSVSVVPTPNATRDGYVCQIGTDSYMLGIWYDSGTKKFSAIETTLDSSGDPIDYVLSTSTSAWAGGMETMTVTATTVKLGSSGTTGTRHSSYTMLGSLVAVGCAMVSDSHGRLLSGEVKHLALWSGTVPAGLSSDVLTGPSAMFTMSTAVAKILAWSGYPVSVSTLGTDRAVLLQKTEGISGADMLSLYAQGSLSRIFCGGDGNVVVAAWDYLPTAITAPSGDIDRETQWGSDMVDQVEGATMTWPDGSTYTAGTAGGLDLPGILDTASGQAVTDWVVATAGTSQARFPDATYHLLTMSDAEAAALAPTDIASILLIPGLPTQLPATSQSGIVEAITKTFAADAWDVQFTTSADDRDRALVVGDATRGKVTNDFLAAPLGPVIDGAGNAWRAGDEVTATKLNANAFPGADMQAGRVSITPVANTPTSVAVTFARAFASTPKVVVTPETTTPGSEVIEVGATSASTTGFTAWIYRTNTSATYLDWIATV